MARLSVTQTRAGTGEKSQAAKSLSCVSAKRAKQKKRNRRSAELASKHSVSVVCTVDFQADDYFEL